MESRGTSDGERKTVTALLADLKGSTAHDDGPFDAEWMTAVFEEDWEKYTQYACGFTNALLELTTPSVAAILEAGATSSTIADAFFSHFYNPREFWPWLVDLTEAKKWVTERTTY